MPTEWFTDDGSGIAIHNEDPNMAIIGDYVPDRIKLPEKLGAPDAGRELRVLKHWIGTCPKCKAWKVRYLMLEDRYCIAECNSNCGFVIARYREEPNLEDLDNG